MYFTYTHTQLGTQTNTHTRSHTLCPMRYIHIHVHVHQPHHMYVYLYSADHEVFQQCLQAVLLLFSINFPIFQYFASFFSILPDAPYTVLQYVQSLPNFSVFSEFCQYFCSEFSKNTGKSVYLEAIFQEDN